MGADCEEMFCAEIMVLSGVSRTLTYAVPKEIEKGFLVEVPLMNKKKLGVVLEVGVESQVPKNKLKSIVRVLYDMPLLTEDLMKLASWIRYYGCSSESTYEAMIPASVRSGMNPKYKRYLLIKKTLDDEAFDKLSLRAGKQAKAYKYLEAKGTEVLYDVVLEDVGVTSAVCKSLVDKGIVQEIKKEEKRDAYSDDIAGAEVVAEEPPELTQEQAVAYKDIGKSLDEGKFCVHLLHGVTGSGKTEVYLQAINKVLEEGGTVLFLVPEVALTPQIVGRLRSRLDSNGANTMVWHSQLSEGERYDAWLSMARGEAQVVVGARSAVFAPLQNLKLVVVDEEHDTAYKQGETPRYHGRDLAVYRSMLCGAVCVLGSATPALESLYNVELGKYKLNKLTKRIDDRQLPLVHVVDMKQEILRARKSVAFSKLLMDKLHERFKADEQSILFINRRGYSSKVVCPNCTYVAQCNHCSVSLTYHKTDGKIRCHVCGFEQKVPEKCPECSSTKILWRGFGTQKIEDAVQKIVPRARIVRIDADTMSKKNEFREILADFRKGKIDILVGTQMIAKGLDFPNVTLVGLIDADISLHIPDFRASERTFQLVVQVAGRAGRGDRAGEVVVQSFLPHSAPIQFARRADFEGFLEEELENRREYNYPPFRHLIRHVFRSRSRERVEFFVEKWAQFLAKNLSKRFGD